MYQFLVYTDTIVMKASKTFLPSFLPLLLLSTPSYDTKYLFGQVGAAFLAVSPLSLSPSPSGTWQGEGWRNSVHC